MTGLWFAIQFFENKHFRHGDTEPYLKYRKLHRFCYAAISGTAGAQSVLFAKCCSELLVNTISGNGVMFVYYQTYLVLLCMIASIVLQIKWLNAGLLLFDALYIVPVFQTFWITVSVISGLVFFGEYSAMSLLSAIMFPTGIVCTIAGVFVLSQRNIEMTTEEAELTVHTPLLSHLPVDECRRQMLAQINELTARPRSSSGGAALADGHARTREGSYTLQPGLTVGVFGSAALIPSMMGRASMVYTSRPYMVPPGPAPAATVAVTTGSAAGAPSSSQLRFRSLSAAVSFAGAAFSAAAAAAAAAFGSVRAGRWRPSDPAVNVLSVDSTSSINSDEDAARVTVRVHPDMDAAAADHTEGHRAEGHCAYGEVNSLSHSLRSQSYALDVHSREQGEQQQRQELLGDASDGGEQRDGRSAEAVSPGRDGPPPQNAAADHDEDDLDLVSSEDDSDLELVPRR